MGDSGMELQGIDELLSNLQRLGERVASRMENQALKSGGQILADAAAQKAPRGPHKEHLKDHIIVSRVKTDPGSGLKYVEVGPDKKHFYANFLEWGTKKMPAHPFLYPALVETRDQIFAEMARVLREALQE